MTLKTFLMGTASAALLAGAVAAQEVSTDTDTTATGDTGAATMGTDAGAAAPAPEFTSLDQMTVGDVLGLKVTDTTFAKIGEIDYVVPQGEGAAAVIGIGGFLGLGEYTVALPLEDFSYNAEQRVLVLPTDKETLKAQPEFDESGAESLPDETPVASLLNAGSDDAAASSESDATMQSDSSAMGDEASGEAADGADTGSSTDTGAADTGTEATDADTEMGTDAADPVEEGSDTTTTTTE